MTRAALARGAFAITLVLAVAAGSRALRKKRAVGPAAQASPAISSSAEPATPDAYQGFLYGRISTVDGALYEGRLRWGGDQEAFWGDYFNGAKKENPWVAQVPTERLPKDVHPIEILGIRVGQRERPIDTRRLFMVRFGDIGRIDAGVGEVHVTLKSGTVFTLDRFAAGDVDDGVRVWDARRGVVDLDARRVRAIELLPTAPLGGVPDRLHGTLRTRQGDYTGFIQWDREECVGADELVGRTAEGERRLRFDTIRSIARRSRDSSLVTLLDGREIVLSGREVGEGNRGIYVEDRRYGRVLVSWDAFDRVDLSPGGSGPAYGDFPPGSPITGSVTARSGSAGAAPPLEGRLVFDLDETETTETLDAPFQGVDYTILFGLIASIVPPGPGGDAAGLTKVVLHDGQELQLERSGDVGQRNGGVLVLSPGRERPDYVRWEEVQRIDLDRPPAMYP